MKALVRALNERGLARFRAWLEAGAIGAPPSDLLDDPDNSEPIPGSGEIEQRDFPNRYELALHILDALSGCDFNRLSFHKGLWAWLSLFYFDVLCPDDSSGGRKLLAMERYLFEPAFRRAGSHLIREAVLAGRNHGQNAKVLLISPRGGIKVTKVLSELSSRQELISNSSVVELAWRLYFDSRRQAVRHGTASTNRPGSVQRFALVLQQLSLNYDLPAMTARQVADLLPGEFEAWKRRANFDGEPKGPAPREAMLGKSAVPGETKAHVTFDGIAVGTDWEREQLAQRWGYRTFHALARGVFTPAADNKIILFVTETKQEHLRQHADKLHQQTLTWEGEASHTNDQRIASAEQTGEEIHVFYRALHHTPFRYLGRVRINEARLHSDRSSEFVFALQ